VAEKEPEAAMEKAAPPDKETRDLKESQISEIQRKIKNAFDEKRVMQMFQPVITLMSEEENDDEKEIYTVSFQLIDTDGSIMNAEQVRNETDFPAFHKFIDRWMIRETIGRVVTNETCPYLFWMRLSDASLADATLFNWLRKILTGLDSRNPGHSLGLILQADDFAKLQTQTGALINYLGKSHGFSFILAGLKDAGQVKELIDKESFNSIKMSFEMIIEQGMIAQQEEPGISLLQHLKSKGINVIAENIEDSTTLTEVISAGATHATGLFLGEPTDQLDNISSIESLEII